MNTLVLIGLALVAAGFVLLAVRLAPRMRRQFAPAPTQPRTVADLVRLRQENAAETAPAAQQAASSSGPAPAPAQVAVPEPQAAEPEPAAPPAEPERAEPAPAFAPPPPRPTPVAGRVRREAAEPPSAPLDGDNSPWQRGARMAVGLGGGQPWREPPAPPTPLRVVPADTDDEEAAATPARHATPTAGPVRLVPSAPETAEPEAAEPAGVRLVPEAPDENAVDAETAAPVAEGDTTRGTADAGPGAPVGLAAAGVPLLGAAAAAAASGEREQGAAQPEGTAPGAPVESAAAESGAPVESEQGAAELGSASDAPAASAGVEGVQAGADAASSEPGAVESATPPVGAPERAGSVPVEPEHGAAEPGSAAAVMSLAAGAAVAWGAAAPAAPETGAEASSTEAGAAATPAAGGEESEVDEPGPGSAGAVMSSGAAEAPVAPEEGGEEPPVRSEAAEAGPGAGTGPAVNRDAVWVAPEVVQQQAAEQGAAGAGEVPAEPSVSTPEPEAVDAGEAGAADPAPAAEARAVAPGADAAPPVNGGPPRAEVAPAVNSEVVWGGTGPVVGGLTAAAMGGAAVAAGAARTSREDEVDGVPASAVPEQFAGEPSEQAAPRRGRQTPDERAAEEAAADLALLRTFGRPGPASNGASSPAIAVGRSADEQSDAGTGAAQPVRYRVVRRDGSVVGGATITLLDDRGGDVAAGAADAEGRGEVLAPGPGGYVLVSTAAGHQPGAVAITVGGAATETDVLIARSASVSGAVRGGVGPIAGARVTLVQDGEAVDEVETGADGTFRIKDIGAGEYGLSVAASGREPVTAVLEVPEEAEVRHDVELRPAAPIADSDLVDDDAMSGLR